MGPSAAAKMGPPLTALQYDLVYNMISFGLASMMASTVFFFLRLSSFSERYKAALCFTGLVTLIAMYHYMRIFNSFEASYTPCEVVDGEVNPNKCDPAKYGYTATGIAFNDAYRCRLAPHRPSAPHRDRARDEAQRGRDLLPLLHTRCFLRTHDCQRLPW